MRGYPKHYNSKFDYEYARKNFPKSEWEPAFKALLAEQKIWICTSTIADGGSGIEDDDHKIVENTEMDKTITRYQYERIDDPNGLMAQLGYTADEVTKILEG